MLGKENQVLPQKASKSLWQLKDKFSIKGVHITGLLLKSKQWHSFLDIDVAIEGSSGSILDIM
ncbi:MAG: hypothetical protein J7M03_07385 [Candidatus Desulfofervidaceae bacterium]|nr:hypothetical protein [Candidatus Desulfofervidaceae bacterium]MDL1970306.1 hypothetical protein [Candidatus Desulfofervidaceae bacterium]